MADTMLISVSEAARKLGLSESTVRAKVRTGEIRSKLIGKRNRKIPVEALREYTSAD